MAAVLFIFFGLSEPGAKERVKTPNHLAKFSTELNTYAFIPAARTAFRTRNAVRKRNASLSCAPRPSKEKKRGNTHVAEPEASITPSDRRKSLVRDPLRGLVKTSATFEVDSILSRDTSKR